MFLSLTAVVVSCIALAARIELPPPAMPEHADTEVATNIPFVAANGHVRFVELAFALDGCASNCVQVAFGHDADGDGMRGITASVYRDNMSVKFLGNGNGLVAVLKP